MRSAPAVSVRCTGGWVWRVARAALVGVAAVSGAAWVLGHAAAGVDLPWALAVGGVVGLSVWRCAPLPAVVLAWDGARWTADGAAVAPSVAIDAGSSMLLRLSADAGVRWLAVAQRDAGAAWHALRVALYASPRRDAVVIG